MNSITQNDDLKSVDYKFWVRSWKCVHILHGRILIGHRKVANPTKGVLSTEPSYLLNILYINSKTMTLLCNKMDTSPICFYQITEGP